jgi:hypothetical protein
VFKEAIVRSKASSVEGLTGDSKLLTSTVTSEAPERYVQSIEKPSISSQFPRTRLVISGLTVTRMSDKNDIPWIAQHCANLLNSETSDI